jgi:hypothetical protein
MGTGELTSRGGGAGKTCWHLGGGVADAGDGAGIGATAGGGDDGTIGSIRTPLDGSRYEAKRDSSTLLL